MKIGKMVFLNFSFAPKAGTTLLPNSKYGVTYAAIPSEIRPAYNVFLNGFACTGAWFEATQIAIHIAATGLIEYSTPSAKAFYKVSGCWTVD